MRAFLSLDTNSLHKVPPYIVLGLHWCKTQTSVSSGSLLRRWGKHSWGQSCWGVPSEPQHPATCPRGENIFQQSEMISWCLHSWVSFMGRICWKGLKKIVQELNTPFYYKGWPLNYLLTSGVSSLKRLAKKLKNKLPGSPQSLRMKLLPWKMCLLTSMKKRTQFVYLWKFAPEKYSPRCPTNRCIWSLFSL